MCKICTEVSAALPEFDRIAVFGVLLFVQRKRDDGFRGNAARKQIVAVDLVQQIGFALPSKPGDDLDFSVLIVPDNDLF